MQREVRLAAAIESLNAEELTLDEKQRQLGEAQAAYDVLMQQRQVGLRVTVLLQSIGVNLSQISSRSKITRSSSPFSATFLSRFFPPLHWVRSAFAKSKG